MFESQRPPERAQLTTFRKWSEKVAGPDQHLRPFRITGFLSGSAAAFAALVLAIHHFSGWLLVIFFPPAGLFMLGLCVALATSYGLLMAKLGSSLGRATIARSHAAKLGAGATLIFLCMLGAAITHVAVVAWIDSAGTAKAPRENN
jgi:hypothetical protein